MAMTVPDNRVQAAAGGSLIEAKSEARAAWTSVPEDAFAGDIALFATIRGGHVETLHRGTFAVCTPDGELLVEGGNAGQRTYLRSSAKPFQGLALVTTGAVEALGLNQEDIAIGCASHSGQPEHVRAAERLLAKAGLGPDLLQCGVHAPTNAEAAAALVASGQPATALNNNCSGKHSAMLVVCRVMGWPYDTYLEAEHPLQRLNRETLAAFAGVNPESIDIGVDGCGVPTFYLPVRNAGTAFARLASGRGVSDNLAEAAEIIRKAMMAHPFLVAGSGRFDTDVMTAAGGSVVSKGGAQGFGAVGLTSEGLGIGLKMSDGSSTPIGGTLLQILRHTANLPTGTWESLSRYERPPTRNHAGKVVGSMQPVFDFSDMTAYSRGQDQAANGIA